MPLIATATGCGCPCIQSDLSLGNAIFPNSSHHTRGASYLHRPVGKRSGSGSKPWPPETFCLSSCADFGSENTPDSGNSELPMLPRITGKRSGFSLKVFLIQFFVVSQQSWVGLQFFFIRFNLVSESSDSTQLMAHNGFTRIDSNQPTTQNGFLKYDSNRLTTHKTSRILI